MHNFNIWSIDKLIIIKPTFIMAIKPTCWNSLSLTMFSVVPLPHAASGQSGRVGTHTTRYLQGSQPNVYHSQKYRKSSMKIALQISIILCKLNWNKTKRTLALDINDKRKSLSIQHTTYNVQHTTYNIQYTTYNITKDQFNRSFQYANMLIIK